MTSSFDQSLYEIVKRDNQQAGRPFTPSHAIWQQAGSEIVNVMKQEGMKEIETQWVNERFSSRLAHDHRCYTGYASHMKNLSKSTLELSSPYHTACGVLYEYVNKNDVFNLLTRTESTPGNCVIVNDKFVSWDYLMSVHTVTTLAKNDPSLLQEKKVVLDLGPGWGRIGHVLLQVNPKLTYVALDLPEGLMAVRHNMQRLFPEARVLDYLELSSMPVITRQELQANSLVFGGSHHLTRFDTDAIDVVISINSMQEMDPGDQEMYLDHIDTRAKCVYVVAHESSINNKRKRFSDYVWPINWTQLSLTPTGELFFYPDFFEVMFKTR